MSKSGSQRDELMIYDATVQAYGTVFSGFDWDVFCTGTFRKRTSMANAERLSQVFFDRLSRDYLKSPIAYIAVPERRTSGCGLPAIPYHLHFVAAAPPQHRAALLRGARVVWGQLCGQVNVRSYGSQKRGGFYLSKLAGSAEFDYRLHNLERMTYRGPKDLYQSFMDDAYVPAHFKNRTSGETLALRHRGRVVEAA